MSQFNIVVSNTQSVMLVDLKHEAQGVEFSTTIPGGDNMLTFRVPHSVNLVPLWAGFNYRVDLYDSRGLFRSYRMEEFTAESTSNGGEFWNITCYGYGINGDDEVYTSQNVSNTQTSTIVSDAVTALMPQIGATSITASGYTLSAATAITLMNLTGAQIIQWAAQIGNSAQAPMIWYVYADSNGTIRLTLIPRPTTVGYTLRASEFGAKNFGFVGRGIANRVVVEYNGGAGFATREDTALQGAGPNGWNVIRTRKVVANELTQAADANQLGDTLLGLHKVLRMSATRLTGVNPYIIDSNGQEVEPWRVNAGLLCQFEDVDSHQAAQTALSFSNSFLCVGTRYTEDTQTLELTPESWQAMIEAETARASRLLAGRHTV